MSSLNLEALFGRGLGDETCLMLFSMRLDETGTEGRSGFVTVGGAVALIPQWAALEDQWGEQMGRKKVGSFHLVDFDPPRQGPFENWSDLKAGLFERRLKRIIKDNVAFQCAISINSAAHAEVKERMRGVSGFAPSSDYSLCLRYLMFMACESLVTVDPQCQLAVLVEDGPWAAGAAHTYQKVAAMQGKWKPAKHAHRLAGFGSLPKGALKSLDAADYIVGREHGRLTAGRKGERGTERLAHLLSADDLESWYDGMMREKELRRAFGSNPRPSE